MSESMVCCPLSNDGYEDGPSCCTESIRKARKEHWCCECRETIKVGDRYEYVSGIWDGRADSYKTCLLCKEIRDHFSCGHGWVYGEVWSQLTENFFPDMKAGGQCMAGLSPAAKQYLIDLRMEWYFAQDECNDSRWEGWTPDKPPGPLPVLKVDNRTILFGERVAENPRDGTNEGWE